MGTFIFVTFLNALIYFSFFFFFGDSFRFSKYILTPFVNKDTFSSFYALFFLYSFFASFHC